MDPSEFSLNNKVNVKTSVEMIKFLTFTSNNI